jgi:hypothetical protein
MNSNKLTTIEKLRKEYKKISKRYFELEEKEFRTFEEQKEIDAIEVRMAEISNLLEN